MLLQTAYEKFIKNTDLTDSIYKSVFSKISDILEKINVLEWISLKYKSDSEDFSIDLKNNTIPMYVVEIIKNVFEDFYMFPSTFDFELIVLYDKINYSIKYSNGVLVIPEEISFIKEYGLFELFIQPRPVYDIFSEFNRYFKFTNSFTTKTTTIPTPLKRKFEEEDSQRILSDNPDMKNKILSNEVIIGNLSKQQKEISDSLDNIRKEISKLTEDRSTIKHYLSIKESLLYEKNSLKSEVDLLQKAADESKATIERISSVLSSIDEEFRLNPTGDTNGFLKERKIIFTKELEQRKGAIEETTYLLSPIQKRLKELEEEYGRIASYNEDDLTVLNDKIQKLHSLQDNHTASLLGINTEIQNMKGNIIEESKIVEQSNTLNKPQSTLDTQSIIEYISVPVQPMSVTTVVNYLRYYFGYLATGLSATLQENNKDTDYSVIQAVACRTALANGFNLIFKNCFSIYNFADSRHELVSVIK